MNYFERFKDLLEENDFDIEEDLPVTIPQESDATSQMEIIYRASTQMVERNFHRTLDYVHRHSALLENLCDLYLQANSSEKALIRALVRLKRKWRKVFISWDAAPSVTDQNMERYTRLYLAAMSIAGGSEDWRDTLVSLRITRHVLEELGINLEPLYQQALGWGGDLAQALELVLDPTHRFRPYPVMN